MSSCNMDGGNRFETVLFQIPQIYSALYCLNLRYNDIKSTQVVFNRIKNDANCFISKSLSVLCLEDNPCSINIKKDRKKKAAILTILKTFKNLFYIDSYTMREDAPEYFDSDVVKLLHANHAGRSIIEGAGGGSRSPLIPLSIWPTIIVRAYERSEDIYDPPELENHFNEKKNPSGLFYLLREGPALAGQCDFSSSSSSNNYAYKFKSLASLSETGNDDGGIIYNADETKHNPSRKRKRTASASSFPTGM